MNKKTFFLLITGLLLCFIAGCKDSSTPEKPVVVKQSINKTATTTPEPETKTPATATQTAPQETQQVTATEAPGQEKAAEAPAPTKETPAAPAAEEKAVSETPVAPAQKETPPVVAPPDQTVKTPAEPTSGTTSAETPAATDTAAAPVPTAETEEKAGPLKTESASASLKSSLMEDDTTPPYDPTGKTDPFAALFSDKDESNASSGSEPKRTLTPLEKVDISQLKLVAILLAKSGNRAVVEDGTGKPYILTPGTYIGINSGSVSKILNDRVVIVETTKDILGRETSSTRELKPQKSLGED